MRKNNVKQEFVFNLFLKFYPNVISGLIGYDINELKVEKEYKGRKIDLCGNTTKEKIFIESQLTRSDYRHLNQIKFIMDNVARNEGTVVVWIAQEFSDDILNAVQNKICKEKRNIELIGIVINCEIIEMLDWYTQIDEFAIIENLYRLHNKSSMKIVMRYYRKFIDDDGGNHPTREGENETEKERIMQLILEEVREQLFYFPTVYREKNLDTNVLVLGGGESDIIYKAGINRYNEVFVELKFHENTKDIFNALLLEKQEIDEKFDYLIDWDMRWYRIYSIYPYCRSNEKRIIKRQVRILDKLVKFFADFRNCSI